MIVKLAYWGSRSLPSNDLTPQHEAERPPPIRLTTILAHETFRKQSFPRGSPQPGVRLILICGQMHGGLDRRGTCSSC